MPVSQLRSREGAAHEPERTALKSPRVTVALSAALVWILVAPSVAQSPRVAPGWEDARAAAVAGLEAGKRIRVEAPTTGRVTGTFLRIGDGALLLQGEGGEEGVPIADMTGLWVRGRSTTAGAVVGAVTLGALGALGGAVLCAAFASDSSSADCGAGVALFGLGGALVGGLLGAAVGTAIPQWHRRYP